MIKNIVTLVLITLHTTYNLAQDPCIDAPIFSFSGTNVAYGIMTYDSTISQTSCQGLVYDRDRGGIIISPLETDDNYIVSMEIGNNSGNRLFALDKHSNVVQWSSERSHQTLEDERAIGVCRLSQTASGMVETITTRSFFTWDGFNLPRASGAGYLGRSIIDPIDGTIIIDTWIGDSLDLSGQNNLNLFYLFTSVDSRSTIIPNQSTYVNTNFEFNGWEPSEGNLTISSWFIDSLSLISYNPHPPALDTFPQGVYTTYITLNGPDGPEEAGAGEAAYGPIVDSSTNNRVYFFRFLATDGYRTYQITVDPYGNYVDQVYLSAGFPSDFAWQSQNSYTLPNGVIRLYGVTVGLDDFEYQGHNGYIDIDIEGNIIHDNTALQFDELRVMMGTSTYVENLGSTIHVFRPQENNDLYIYQEFDDGSYREVGHLANNNDPYFAFKPEIVSPMSNNDLFVSFSVVTDTVGFSGLKFDTGGWSGIMKLAADDLDLVTSNTELSSVQDIGITLYPNPTSGIVNVDFSGSNYEKVSIAIYNSLGQKVRQLKSSKRKVSIDISDLPASIYTLHLSDNTVLSVSKQIVRI